MPVNHLEITREWGWAAIGNKIDGKKLAMC